MQLLADLKFSLRLLRKTPGFTLATFAVLVLGLSLFLMSYTFVRMMSDKPMPFPEGDRYVTLKTINENIGDFDYSAGAYDYYTFNRLKSSSENYSTLGAYVSDSFVFSDGDYSQRFSGARISPDLFSALTVAPARGGIFAPQDFQSQAENVAVISYTLWQDYYNSDDNIIGRSSQINGEPSIILGVMPEGFQFPTAHDVWFPLPILSAAEPNQGLRLTLVGILNHDSTLAAAEAELNSLLGQQASEFPEFYANRSELVLPYAASSSPVTNGFNGALLFITLVILTLGVVNLSSLLLIRASSRQQELAVRSSLGANSWHLMKQVLLESSVICSGGLLLSIGLAAVLLPMLEMQFLNSQSSPLPFWFEFKVDWDVIAAGGICAGVIWVLTSMFVARQVYRQDLTEVLAAGSKGDSGAHGSWLTRLVVGSEVTLSCFLLVCCGVGIYFSYQVANTDYGVDTRQYLLASFDLEHPDYSSARDRIAYLENLKRGVEALSAMKEMAYTSAPPGSYGQFGYYEIDELNLNANEQRPSMRSIWASENYLSLLGAEVIEGRLFDGSDNGNSQPVAIINEQFALTLWPNTSAIGKSIQSVVDNEEQTLTVIGVISSLRQSPSRMVPNPDVIYRPVSQNTPDSFFMVASVQSAQSIAGINQRIRSIGTQLERDIPIEDIQMMDVQISKNQGAFDVLANIFAVFSIGTLLLAVIGIYSVIARTVADKTQEIGIHRALGSTNLKILAKFVSQGFRYLTAGIVLGVVPAIIIIGSDPSAFMLADNLPFLLMLCVLVVSLIAFLISIASYIPAQKAIAMEPGDALRYE